MPTLKKEIAKKMCNRYLAQGLTYAEMGEKLGVSRQRVYQILKE